VLSATEDVFYRNVFKGFGRRLVKGLVGFEAELSELVGAESVYLLFG
jgi:hypothetical protein